jgi:hypothetical protein
VIVSSNVPEDGHNRPKHVVKEKDIWYICTTNCVDRNNNKTLSYTQYDAEVHFLPARVFIYLSSMIPRNFFHLISHNVISGVQSRSYGYHRNYIK